MDETTVYILALILCIIGLIELAIGKQLKHILALLGAIGAALTGVSIKHHDWSNSLVFLSLVLIAGWFFISHDNRKGAEELEE